MIESPKSFRPLVALVLLAQGTAALEAGNKPMKRAAGAVCALGALAWLNGAAPAPGAVAPAGAPAAAPAVRLDGAGLVAGPQDSRPIPSVPEAAASSESVTVRQAPADPDSGRRRFLDALDRYQSQTYILVHPAGQPSTPARVGDGHRFDFSAILAKHPDPEPGVMLAQGQHWYWVRDVFRSIRLAFDLDQEVMALLSGLAARPEDLRPDYLDRHMPGIRDTRERLVQEMTACWNEYLQYLDTFQTLYPGVDVHRDLRAEKNTGMPDDLLADQAQRTQTRYWLMHDAQARYRELFEPAIRDLVPQRDPFGKDDERSNGQKPKATVTAPQATRPPGGKAIRGKFFRKSTPVR